MPEPLGREPLRTDPKRNAPSSPRLSWLALAVATAGGAGLLRPAPGTWGSVVAAVMAAAVLLIAPDSGRWWLLALVAASVFLSAWAVPQAVRHFHRSDPSQVVLDEVAGVWLGLVVLPAAVLAQPVVAVLLVTLWFRFFDIVKPGPVGALEALGGTAGIMADDCAAGLLAGAVTMAILA